MNLKIMLILTALINGVASTAMAGIITDQEQPIIDLSAGYLGIGGDSQQKLAQSFTVGFSGNLVGLRLPITGCGNGSLQLMLREVTSDGLPTGAALRVRSFPAVEVGSIAPGEYQDFYFPASIEVDAGDVLAFTAETFGMDSFCSYAQGPNGDSYIVGNAFFDSRPNPPGWVPQSEFPLAWQDLPFYTLMSDPSLAEEGMCVAADGTPLPISGAVPVCRCFEDAGAMESRCGIFHPDFFIIRRIPLPIAPNRRFKQIWEFTPLTDLESPVQIEISGGGLNHPRKFKFARHGGGFTEIKVLRGKAPGLGETLEGHATLYYNREDAQSVHFTSFGVDTSITANQLNN